MFEKASRLKLRFESGKGLLTVEDLWDVSLTSKSGTSLDNIAKGLHNQLKEEDEVSFVAPVSRANAELNLKFDIVKHIIGVRLAEREERKNAKEKKEEKEKILSIIAKKKDAELENLSVEELEAMVK